MNGFGDAWGAAENGIATLGWGVETSAGAEKTGEPDRREVEETWEEKRRPAVDIAGGEGPTEEKAGRAGGGAAKVTEDVAEGVGEGAPIADAAMNEERNGPEEEEGLEAAKTEGEAADEKGGATGATEAAGAAKVAIEANGALGAAGERRETAGAAKEAPEANGNGEETATETKGSATAEAIGGVLEGTGRERPAAEKAKGMERGAREEASAAKVAGDRGEGADGENSAAGAAKNEREGTGEERPAEDAIRDANGAVETAREEVTAGAGEKRAAEAA
jgi:hypothetical protein